MAAVLPKVLSPEFLWHCHTYTYTYIYIYIHIQTQLYPWRDCLLHYVNDERFTFGARHDSVMPGTCVPHVLLSRKHNFEIPQMPCKSPQGNAGNVKCIAANLGGRR